MAQQPRLIVQVARGGAVARQLSAQAPPSVAAGEVVVEVGPADAQGHLEPPSAGKVVVSVPLPETLVREAAEIRGALAGAGTGVEPALVVVVEAGEELRDDELAGHSTPPRTRGGRSCASCATADHAPWLPSGSRRAAASRGRADAARERGRSRRGGWPRRACGRPA